MALVISIFFSPSVTNRRLALKRMRACLIRGRGIDLQGFNQYCMQSLAFFVVSPLGQVLSIKVS